MTKTFEDLENQVQNLGSQVRGLNEHIEGIETDIGTDIHNAEQRIKETVNGFRARLDRLDEWGATVNLQMNMLKPPGDLDAMQVMIAALVKRVTMIEGSPLDGSGRLQSSLEQRQLDAHHQRIKDLEERPTNMSNQNQLASQHDRIRSLEILLLGDVEAMARYEAGKANYPNIRKPDPGWIEAMQNSVEALGARHERISGELVDKLKFTARLEAFFGPLLAGKNPPLDGEQIATKGYVDTALQRLSDALKARFATTYEDAALLAKELAVQFAQATSLDTPPGQSRMLTIAERLSWVLRRETERHHAELEKKRWKRSRMSSLVYAITGRTNGDPR